MAIYYVDPINGNDANNGTTFALRKKTINSASLAALTSGDEIRVMQSAEPVNVGASTWVSQTKGSTSAISSISTTGLVTTSSTHGYSVGDYILITGNSSISKTNYSNFANSVWRISSTPSTTSFQLEDWDSTNVTSVAGGAGSHILIDGAIVESSTRFHYELPITTWTAATLANPQTEYQLNATGTNTIWGAAGTGTWVSNSFSGSNTSSTSSLVVPRPGSAYRVSWTAQFSTTANFSSITKVNYDPTGWTTVLSAQNGVDNAGYQINSPFSFYWDAGGYSTLVVYTNSWMTIGSNTGYQNQSIFSTSNPFIRKWYVNSNYNFSASFIGTKTIGTSPNRVFCVLYRGNNTLPSTNIFDTPNMIYEYRVYETSTVGGQSGTQWELHVHNNANYDLVTLAPSITVGSNSAAFSKWDTGYLINPQGATTGTVVATAPFSTPLDLSAYRTFSCFIKLGTANSAGVNSSNYEFRLVRADNSFITIPIDSYYAASFNTSTFVALDYTHTSNLPNDIASFQIVWVGISTAASTNSFYISNIAAGIDGFGYNKLIGRNLPDHQWYRFKSVRYKPTPNKTIFELSENISDIAVSNFGVTYLNGTSLLTDPVQPETFNNVDLYFRDYFLINNSGGSLTIGGSNINNRIITGGWNTTDMSTRTGQTFYLSGPYQANAGLSLSNHNTTIENFGLYNFSSAITLTSTHGSIIKNCWLGYNNNGITHGGTTTVGTLIQNIKSVANTFPLSFGVGCHNVDAYDIKDDCSGAFNSVASEGNASINLFNCTIQGCRTAVNFTNCVESNAFNTKILAQNAGTNALNLTRAHNVGISSIVISRASGNGAIPYNAASSVGCVIRDYFPSSFSFISPTSTVGSTVLDSSVKVFFEDTARKIYIHSVSPFTFSNNYTTSNYLGITTNCWGVFPYAATGGSYTEQEAQRFKLAEVPVIANNSVTVSIKSKVTTEGRVSAKLDLDTIESNIGITAVGIGTTHPGVYIYTPGLVNTWSDYSFNFTPLSTGIANIYLKAWTDGSSSTGPTLWIDQFKIE